jgi:hypothetical protein
LRNDGQGTYGTFPAPGNWKSNGTLQTLDETIIVENGKLIAPKPTDPDQDQADFDGKAPDRTFTVSSLEQWNAAIEAIKNGGDNKNYVITVDGDFDVPGTTDNTFDPAANITVSLRGSGTLSLDETSTGSIIRAGANQTVILRGLTLKGHSSNTREAVSSRGTFIMHSGAITGNTTSSNGGGVWMNSGTFTMDGGTISGNTAGTNGGGVYMTNSGVTFTMHGGTISGNKANGTGATNGGGGV